MYLLFISVVTFFSLQTAAAQVPPSSKAIEAQKQQAILEAKQMVADLKKQIAAAKATNDDPDGILQMENQLKIMEQTVAMLDKTTLAKRPTALPPPKKVLPKYVSPIVPIVLKQPVVAPTKIQAKDSLLWYRGRRLNDSTLVTMQNTVVQYSRRRNLLVVQADRREDSLSLNIATSLGKCSQWTNDFVNDVAAVKNSFFEYPQTMNTMEELAFIDKTYHDILKNTINLPSPTPAITMGSKTGPSHATSLITASPDAFLDILHQNLVNEMRNAPSLNVREPSNYFACVMCGRFKERHDEIQKWKAEFLKYEKGLLEKMAAIKIWMIRQGITSATSGIAGLDSDLNEALTLAFERWDRKVSILEEMNNVDPFGNDLFYTHIVIESLLYLQVQKKLYYGIVDNSYTSRINNLLVKNQQGIIDFFEREMRDYQYHEVLDTWIVSGFNRHHKILKGSGEPLRGLVEKIRKFNRFELKIDIRFEVGFKRDEGIPFVDASGTLTTRDKVYLRMGRLGNCRWQFYLADADYTKQDENSFRIPFVVQQGVRHIYLMPTITRQYSGPTDLLMVFPYTSFDLCSSTNEDSVIVDILRYKQEDLSRYNPGEKEYSVDLLQYVNKIFVSVDKVQPGSGEIVNRALQMMNAAFVHAKVDNPTGYSRLDQMQVDYKMRGIQQHHQEMLARTSHFSNTVIPAFMNQGRRQLLMTSQTRRNEELEEKYELKMGSITVSIVHAPETN